MKGKPIVLIAVIFLILIFMVILWGTDKNVEKSIQSDGRDISQNLPLIPPPPIDEETQLAFSEKMLEDFSYSLMSFPIGNKVPDLALKDHKGEEFSLNNYAGKKMLLYFDVEACESCLAYYSILRDWARRYQDQLQIIMFFKYEPREGFIAELVNSGIRLVPRAEEAIKAFDARFTANYLVDASGKVKHYFDFEYLEWMKIDNIIDNFVKHEKIPDVQRDYLKKGFPIPEVYFGFDVDETNELSGSDLKGKPSLVFMNDQICMACEEIYPLINKLSEKYGNKANIILLLSGLRNNRSYDLASKFYEKYNLPMPGIYEKTFDGENPIKDYVTKKQIKASVYPALETAMERWGVTQIPGVLILDHETKIKYYLLFERQQIERKVPAEEFLVKELEKLLMNLD